MKISKNTDTDYVLKVMFKRSSVTSVTSIFQRELSIIDFTLNYQPIRNNLTSASLLSMLIETDYLNYPPIRNNLTSASMLSMIIEMDYNSVGYESHDRAALPLRNLPRQKYIFHFPKH